MVWPGWECFTRGFDLTSKHSLFTGCVGRNLPSSESACSVCCCWDYRDRSATSECFSPRSPPQDHCFATIRWIDLFVQIQLFPVIAWMAAARQKDKIFSASAARTHQDMANRIASSVNAAVVKIRQALLSSGYDEVGFIVCRLERDQCEISRDWWHKGIDPAESGNYRMGKSGKEFCSQAWAMNIKQSFSWRKSRQSLEPCFGGIKKSYPCLLFESWDWVVGGPTEWQDMLRTLLKFWKDMFGTQASTLTRTLKDFEAVVFPVVVHCVWTTQAKSYFAVVLPDRYLQRDEFDVSYIRIYIYMGSGRFPGPMELLLQQLVRVSKTRWR